MVPRWVFFSILPFQILFGSMHHGLFKVAFLIFSSLLYAHDVYTPTRVRVHIHTHAFTGVGLENWDKWNKLSSNMWFCSHREPDSMSEFWVSPLCFCHPLDSWHGTSLTLGEDCSLFGGIPVRAGMDLISPPLHLVPCMPHVDAH